MAAGADFFDKRGRTEGAVGVMQHDGVRAVHRLASAAQLVGQHPEQIGGRLRLARRLDFLVRQHLIDRRPPQIPLCERGRMQPARPVVIDEIQKHIRPVAEIQFRRLHAGCRAARQG